MDRWVGVIVAGVVALAACVPLRLAAAEPPRLVGVDAWHLCSDTAREIERREQLPETMLEAITTVETGRGAPGETILRPWPWTVTAEGRGQHYASRADAIEAVRALRARGVNSIDVGCMQVNLYFHPGAFTSLEEAFTPASNIAYAAKVLKGLKKSEGTWETAIEHYHSYDPDRRLSYRLKVFASWQDIVRDRNVFRLASEVSLERLGAPGAPLRAASMSAEPPVLAGRDGRHRGPLARLTGGPFIRLASLDSPSPSQAARGNSAPLIVIAVDLRPRPSDRPDPTKASVFGGTTVAAADHEPLRTPN